MRSGAVRQTLTRRELLRGLSATSMLAVEAGRPENTRPSDFFPPSQAGSTADESKRWKGSALGNLYPFIKQQQEKTRQSFAFLHRRPKDRSEEHTSELQSRSDLVCRLLLEKKKK